MNKKLAALTTALAICTTAAFAVPTPELDQGQLQLDLGGWNVKHDNVGHIDAVSGASKSNYKWNFAGGLAYGLTDKVSLEYAYHGLKTENSGNHFASKGNENEINMIYGLNKNIGVYAGWNRIKNNFEGTFGNNHFTDNMVNNVAQFGLIARTPLFGTTSLYARGAVGTKHTYLWEAGLGIGLGQNADLNIGYREVKTRMEENTAHFSGDAHYKGLIAGLTLRFGGGEKVAAPAPVIEEPKQEVAAPAPELKDYYLDSIHFDFDIDTPKASETPKLVNFVNVAKANPANTFKLVGDTDAKGSDTYNNDLSKRRVVNVAKYATDHGVPASQLQATYRGKTDPAETNTTDAGRAANRRVDIWWTK